MASVQIVEFQLDLFETHEERANRMRFEASELELEKVKRSLDRVRKGTYASINELRKTVEDIELRLNIIERNICNGKI